MKKIWKIPQGLQNIRELKFLNKIAHNNTTLDLAEKMFRCRKYIKIRKTFPKAGIPKENAESYDTEVNETCLISLIPSL